MLPAFPALAMVVLQYDLMVSYRGKPKAVKFNTSQPGRSRPNIIMIGCDTFRADYLGKVSSKGLSLTPNLDSLCSHATRYTNMITPIARTAPSLASLFCSEWPSQTRLWDNFTDPKSVNLKSHLHTLAAMGYRTATCSDWAGSDFARYDFGFQDRETPADQWNIRYLLGQGAKQYRLFLSLFSAGRIGKKMLPEIHYAAGIPQNRQSTYRFCEAINRYSKEDAPFLLNLFISTAHPPFGSEAPYYNLYSEQRDTSSPFCMVKLTEPEEIIKSQRDPKVAFELDQVISLYEGCISNFDQRVGDIIEHLKRSGLYDDCALVIYSDHGIDFFEKNSWGQGNNLDGLFSNRVPCIIKVPNQAPEVNDSFCSNRDIFPTLLARLNLVPPKLDKGNAQDYASGEGTAVETQFLETGVWITRPPSATDDHLYYPDIDQILDVTDHETGTIVLDQAALEMIDQAKDRAIIHPPWILVRKPCHGGPRWSLYHLLLDPLMEEECSQEQPELLESLKNELNDHFFGSV
ncbi:sulfatase family protein [Aestuariirhabdus litorea]|nr:sulfatase-like hydrolase/transferase [Aestuariirhabdus litorea]